MKQCGKCGETKPLDEFYVARSGKEGADGRQSYCKACIRTYKRDWRAREGNTSVRADDLMRKFQMTIEQYDAMLAEQGGRCRICKRTDPAEGNKIARYFCVDHDHSCCPSSRSCGQCVRGLICHPCNTLLASARDNVDVLRAAIEYLQRYSATVSSSSQSISPS